MLTLRQIEVVRAVMVSGSISRAAKLLNVSASGISRLIKYTESSLKIRLFQRHHGRYVPTPEANGIFEQINGVYKKVDDLSSFIERIQRGASLELRLGSVPSISHVMVPRAVERLRRRYPDLKLDINILRIEEAVDYLLLDKGELIALSQKLEHPSIDCLPLAAGKLHCIVPINHPLVSRTSITAQEITLYPLIGIDPDDPYGRIMAQIFRRKGLDYNITIRARFGVTLCALVKAGLGIGIIDRFTVAHEAFPGICILEIDEPTDFETFVGKKAGAELSMHAGYFVSCLRREMQSAGAQCKSARNITSC
jgi:DNA-binding transcriptional LysR family regulator